MSAGNTVNIDLAALEQEINALTPAEIHEQLLAVRTKQRVQQKKYHNTESQLKYRKERAEKMKLIAAAAKRLGIYDQIKKEAEEAATAKLAADQGESDAELEMESSESVA